MALILWCAVITSITVPTHRGSLTEHCIDNRTMRLHKVCVCVGVSSILIAKATATLTLVSRQENLKFDEDELSITIIHYYE